jgi:hypothetical protein
MKKVKLSTLAKVIRSKNSGPFELTLDIIFKSRAVYWKAKERQIITRRSIRELYQVSDDRILNIIYFDPGKAVKITLARRIPSGDICDTDIYGAQQHMPLVDIMCDWDGNGEAT